MWQPIETAPKDNKRPLWLARFNDDGTMQSFDYNGSWESESESWEMPEVYYYWASENGNVEEPSHWAYQPEGFCALPGAQPAQKAVAYLDLGVGGYMDIGTDLNDEQLASLPKGRHMLGIVGTYGVDGYVSAQPAPSVPEGWKPIPEKHPTFDLVDLRLADGSVLCGCVPQSDGDYWWNGPSGEVFIDPKYAPATHWRLAAAPEAKP